VKVAARLLWSIGGLGLVPFAPGTFGTLAGVALAALASRSSFAEPIVLSLAAFFTIAGVPLANLAERAEGKDPRSFVWDEVAGYLVTLLGLPVARQPWLCVIGAFFVFRILDILKPWPCGKIEKQPGGVAVMADDVMAGIYGNVVMWIILWALPRFAA
jgi:phosphatidylglycerophosphatase A